jgi:thiol-disulfide isomerase/thioredoxin
MSKLLINIPYLEQQDVNPDGSLKDYVCQGKPVVVMVQGNFCGYCTQAKPAFQEFSKNTPSCRAVTIQSDGDASDKGASKNLSSVNKSQGVPAFLGFNKQGKFVALHNGGRDMASLQKFASGLSI